MTNMPIVIGALAIVAKELVQGLKKLEITGQVKTIQTIALLRSAKILKSVLENWGDLLSFKLQLTLMWKTPKESMHKALHPRDVDRLYVSRKEGGRGLASIEDTVDASIQRLKDYIEKHERGIITTIWVDTDNTINERVTTTRKQIWEGKQIYGRFKRLINNISHQKTWTWLRKGNLKRETESLLLAAQDSAIRTNHTKARIDKTQQNSKCWLCGDRDETINHIISECSKLAQKEYKPRHDWVDKVIHREMCRKFQFDHTNKWYMHNPAPVLENDSHKLLWGFNIQTDHLIPARRPDLIIINKRKRSAKLLTLLSQRTTE